MVEYLERVTCTYISRYAHYLPVEQREEIAQNAQLRFWQALPRLDVRRGWKAFVQVHARGAVLDYLRAGKGFREGSWSLASDPATSAEAPGLTSRICRRKMEDEHVLHYDMDTEEVAGLCGIFADQEFPTQIRPNWELIARMARDDLDIHLVAKLMMGFRPTELGEIFGVSRECTYQRIRNFRERLDSPLYYNDPWTKQTIYAFGVWEMFGMDAEDLGVGWDLKPVDLFSRRKVRKLRRRVTSEATA